MKNKISLILTCEQCSHVEHLTVSTEDECREKIERFDCPNHCKNKYFSYITIDEIPMPSSVPAFQTVEEERQLVA